MQNFVVLIEPSADAHFISQKGANMCLNRFCIDEDAAFELSGVQYLAKSSDKITGFDGELDVNRKTNGKEYSTEQFKL